MIRFVPVISTLALSASVSFAQDSAAERGAALLAPFKQDLMQALTAGLGEGPVNAIGVCRVQAPEIAAAQSTGGVRVGRTSHRLRNPANDSPEWVRPVLDAYLASDEDRTPRVVRLADDRVGYVEPIVLQPLCVVCHGEMLPREVAAQIEVSYPDDQATGFAVGDLRGVFWVEYPRQTR